MKKNVILTAALFAAMSITSAKAQSIKFFNSCREKSRVINFTKTSAYSEVLKTLTIGSWCPNQQMPKYRLELGNYEFNDLNIKDDEEWILVVEDEKTRKTIKKEILTPKGTWVVLQENQVITIAIGLKFDCQCNVQK